MMPQAAAAVAAAVWRLVQFCVAAQPLRKTTRLIQTNNLLLLTGFSSSKSDRYLHQPRSYIISKRDRYRETRNFLLFFPDDKLTQLSNPRPMLALSGSFRGCCRWQIVKGLMSYTV
jgi:hypothetical protein